MAYNILHLENLTELKTRVGGSTVPTLASILGLNYPIEEGFSVYVWDQSSTVSGDDNEVVVPTPRINSNGRWFKVKLLVDYHTHPISQVNGLDTALANKQDTISVSRLTNWDNAFGWGNHAGLYRPITYVPSWSELTDKPSSYPPSTHTHAISDISNLQTNLDSKSNIGHTHTVGNITNLQNSLDGKAALVHNHAIADITNLQTVLDGKSSVGHVHNISNITGLQTALDSKQNSLTLTTTGTGAATLTGSTLNIPNPSNMFVVNNTTVGLSRATLNSTYPSTPVGFKVLCPSITLGGAVYIRSTTGASGVWQLISAPPVG